MNRPICGLCKSNRNTMYGAIQLMASQVHFAFLQILCKCIHKCIHIEECTLLCIHIYTCFTKNRYVPGHTKKDRWFHFLQSSTKRTLMVQNMCISSLQTFVYMYKHKCIHVATCTCIYIGCTYMYVCINFVSHVYSYLQSIWLCKM